MQYNEYRNYITAKMVKDTGQQFGGSLMNYWTKLSIEYVNQKDYLDELFTIYLTIPEGISKIINCFFIFSFKYGIIIIQNYYI